MRMVLMQFQQHDARTRLGGSGLVSERLHFKLLSLIGLYQLLLFHRAGVLAIGTGQVQEYCEAETFKATCGMGEVVVVQSAQYGRMKLGRCVDRDYGYVGCNSDVLNILDSVCSGRRTCELRLPDNRLDKISVCPKDFKTYLAASYICVDVEEAPCRMCQNNSMKALISGASVGYLSTHTVGRGPCGSAVCPWVVEALPGQLLNFTLFDFGWSENANNLEYMQKDMGICFRYAVIREGSKETDVCGGGERSKLVYTSLTNSVTIEFSSDVNRATSDQFLLKYEAFGCIDPEPPSDSSMARDGDTLIITCTATGRKSTLVCAGSQWDGIVPVCPPGLPSGSDSPEDDGLPLPAGALIAVILGLALVIGIFILSIGLLLIRKRRQEARQQQIGAYQRGRGHYGVVPQYTDSGFYSHGSSSKKYYQAAAAVVKQERKPSQSPSAGSKENEYAGKIEMRPLPSLPNMTEIEDSRRYHRQSSGTHSSHSADVYNLVHTGIPGPSSVRVVGPGSSRPQITATAAVHHEMGAGPTYFELDTSTVGLGCIVGGNIVVPSVTPSPVTTTAATTTTAAAVTNSPDAAAPSSASGANHKSPEQENAENVGKEGSSSHHVNMSCQELSYQPLQPDTRYENHQQGNCSWP